MKNVSIKLDTAIAKQIENDMREFNYSTKTDFIRESIRDKLKALSNEREKRKALQALYSAKGIFKEKGKAMNDVEFRELTEKAGEKYIAQLEKKFAQK